MEGCCSHFRLTVIELTSPGGTVGLWEMLAPSFIEVRDFTAETSFFVARSGYLSVYRC